MCLYTRSQVSVYRTIGPLVAAYVNHLCCHPGIFHRVFKEVVAIGKVLRLGLQTLSTPSYMFFNKMHLLSKVLVNTQEVVAWSQNY